MAKLSVKQIQEAACKIVAEHEDGIRFKPLLDAIRSESPQTPKNTISGAIWDLEQKYPAKVTKPERGLYVPFASTDGLAGGADHEQVVVLDGIKVKEFDFYESFAEWLRAGIGEVTVAAPLGGAGLKGSGQRPTSSVCTSPAQVISLSSRLR